MTPLFYHDPAPQRSTMRNFKDPRSPPYCSNVQSVSSSSQEKGIHLGLPHTDAELFKRFVLTSAPVGQIGKQSDRKAEH
ncbi:hypothetical protein [Roseimaritima sediminicola]|uniref:hypothetical protein n=1 Tax=Roseimaritima sediminicola TaxID=2662066 RepID=UPI001298284B|nr:hypothetical protein [Roseimaritima sediminicola]